MADTPTWARIVGGLSLAFSLMWILAYAMKNSDYFLLPAHILVISPFPAIVLGVFAAKQKSIIGIIGLLLGLAEMLFVVFVFGGSPIKSG